MRVLRRKILVFCLMVFFGGCAGSFSGFCLGRYLLLRAARGTLYFYAGDLSRHADDMAIELQRIFRESTALPFPRCSDQDLGALRSLTFHSMAFKDVGRTRDGVLDCSAFLGRLAKPYDHGIPTLTLTYGTRVYADVPLILTSGHERATLFEVGGINVVLSPEAFESLNRKKIMFQISVVDPKSGRLVPIDRSELTPAYGWKDFETAGDTSTVLRGRFCSTVNPVCATTAENLVDVWAGSRAILAAYLALGGVAGMCLAFSLTTFYLRTESMQHQLRYALRHNSSSLKLVYQPIVQIGSGRCVGVEALIRWNDALGVPVPPDVFIPLAEKSGILGQITAWVIHRGTDDLGALLRERSDFTLSVNVAATDINGERLPEILEECVRGSGIASRQLILELTERSTADLGEVQRSIQRLSEDGYQVHIDDFGTGFSNLSYLDQLAVRAIKVDRAFTRTIGTEAVTASILPQILLMAEALKMDVIVEGVETLAQRNYLENLGKRLCAQGWHFSRPMSAANLLEFLEKSEAAEIVPIEKAVSCV